MATTAAAAPARGVQPTADLEAVELIEASRERASTRLVRRDLVVSTVVALGFLAIAVPLALFADSSRTASPFLIATLIVAYAFASRVRFEIGIGFAIPTQLVFVPMLFLVPPSLAPLLVAPLAKGRSARHQLVHRLHQSSSVAIHARASRLVRIPSS